MTDSGHRSTHEADNAKITVLEENCLNLKLEVNKLTELLEISQHQSNYFEKTAIKHKLEVDELNCLLHDLESQTDFSALNNRLKFSEYHLGIRLFSFGSLQVVFIKKLFAAN
uniref:Uncharacterized protein n=1 Tax=Romanomermis culicivorax TaxID=13658 RepID=A0A915IMY7_ROMCU